MFVLCLAGFASAIALRRSVREPQGQHLRACREHQPQRRSECLAQEAVILGIENALRLEVTQVTTIS